MDFSDKIKVLTEQIPNQREHLLTEAATSTALVLPFINTLGYNVFDPSEVVPEFTADVGIKKGEKVDFAIMKGGEPIILIEVKTWDTSLGENHISQLFRYFGTVKARIGVLTNGIIYKFYTDLEAPNKMDKKPFLEIDMLDLKHEDIEALKQFTSSHFNIDTLASSASELKYKTGIVKIISAEFQEPSEDFVRLMAKNVYSGRMTQPVHDKFKTIVHVALKQFLSDRVNDRLQSAISSDESSGEGVASADVAESPNALPDGIVSRDGDVVTTQEEQDGFEIIKGILTEIVDPSRIVMRDTKSYCGVLLDDNNRKPICRLRFDGKTRYVSMIDAEKNEERVAIDELVDIYKLGKRLRGIVRFYDDKG